MNLKRRKYYPVNLDAREIIDDPHRRERDLAWKYRGHPVVGLKGAHLMAHKVYQAYEIVTPKKGG